MSNEQVAPEHVWICPQNYEAATACCHPSDTEYIRLDLHTAALAEQGSPQFDETQKLIRAVLERHYKGQPTVFIDQLWDDISGEIAWLQTRAWEKQQGSPPARSSPNALPAEFGRSCSCGVESREHGFGPRCIGWPHKGEPETHNAGNCGVCEAQQEASAIGAYPSSGHVSPPADTVERARGAQVEGIIEDWIAANPSLVGELEIQIVRDLSDRISAALVEKDAEIERLKVRDRTRCAACGADLRMAEVLRR